jgi:hypothetical protein
MSTIPDSHKSGDLQNKIKEVMAYLSVGGSMLFAMITLPAMPIIFYMSILFNVIMVVVEFFRNL